MNKFTPEFTINDDEEYCYSLEADACDTMVDAERLVERIIKS